MLRTLINSQIYLSRRCDRLLPRQYRVDGSHDFPFSFVPQYLRQHQRIYDIGGGKNPVIPLELKKCLSLFVIGLDIDQHELKQAPEGSYDETICADILQYQGKQDADIVLCNGVLEHVSNVEIALGHIAGILKPGGRVLLFLPSRNALYARLNLLLPQHIKQTILYSVYPTTRCNQGFPSYYDRCTPSDIRRIAAQYGLIQEAQRVYFISSYFFCCFPAYLLWRAWILLFHRLAGEQAAETFSLALKNQS